MKTIKAWKVIRKKGRVSAIVEDKGFETHYPVGQKVYPLLGGSKLFAFRTRDAARSFRGTDSKLTIVKCLCEQSERQDYHIYHFTKLNLATTCGWGDDNYQTSPPPLGTIFCNWIKCLE